MGAFRVLPVDVVPLVACVTAGAAMCLCLDRDTTPTARPQLQLLDEGHSNAES